MGKQKHNGGIRREMMGGPDRRGIWEGNGNGGNRGNYVHSSVLQTKVEIKGRN